MADKTGISWTTHTWNPWQGCTKVTEGCRFCYMFREKLWHGQDPAVVVRSKDPTFYRPLRAKSKDWNPGDYIFTCSWSDFFHPAADKWRGEAWDIIRNTPDYVYQVLTKRPNRINGHLPADWGTGYRNVWLGVSVEDQGKDFRIRQLSEVPAWTRFVSYEPSLGPLDINPWSHAVDWVIVGGESGGSEARPFDLEWARKVVHDGRLLDIPVFVKQMGSVWARAQHSNNRHGSDPREWPPDLRVQEFPMTVPEAVW